jgi:two-component system, OmpR family, response regulator TctD
VPGVAVICLSGNTRGNANRRSFTIAEMKLLLIEDDPAMRQTLERSLKRQGWLVQSCADGESGLALWRKLSLDAVLLDLSLPGRDGLEILSDARKVGLTTPVLILTARGTVGDRILGLNTGADDYLSKPFDLDELEARIRALVRGRQRGLETPHFEVKTASTNFEYCAVSYEKESGAFYLNEQAMELSPRESAMLAALFERLGHAVSKEQLFERVFPGQADVQTEAVEVVTYRLRKKLAGSGLKLVTLRGLGYLLKHD